MGSLDMDLGKIQEAADMDMDVIAEECAAAAKVRLARASKGGTDTAALLSGLFSTEDAEKEIQERSRKRREAEERRKAEEEAKSEKAKEEAERRLQEENRRMLEMKMRKQKMIAELEKKRRIEEVGYDEEEVARQKAEEEARQKAEEEAEAREIAENERLLAELKASNAELAAKEEAARIKAEAEARAKRTKRAILVTVASVATLVLGLTLTFYFVTKKAYDYYELAQNYESLEIKFDVIESGGMAKDMIAQNIVSQEAPKVRTRTPNGPKPPKEPDNPYGIGKVNTNVFSGDIKK